MCFVLITADGDDMAKDNRFIEFCKRAGVRLLRGTP
jgi:hypothetical protein